MLTDNSASAPYTERARVICPPGTLRGWRVGVHQHSAVGRDLMVTILEMAGADVIVLGRSDVFVPIDTEAVSPEDAAQVRAWIVEHRLDALLTTDGDGDRPLIADETGTVLRGDLVGLLTARWLGADAVATPLSSSTALERSGWVKQVRRSRIGSPYVIEAIKDLAAAGARLPVGYEANGGFLLGGQAIGPAGDALAPLPTRDAMLPILTLLGAAAEQGRPLSVLAADAPPRVTASDRLQEIPPEHSASLLAALVQDATVRDRLISAAGGGRVHSVDTTDGVRLMLGEDEIVHLRASGNAPELRGYAEAATPMRATALVTALLTAAASEINP